MASLTQLFEAIMTPSRPVIVIGLLVVVLFPVLLHFILVRSTPYSAPPSVLLVGPSGAGKTSLLTLLERGDAPAATQTSQIPQSVELTASADAKISFRDQADTAGTHTKFLLVDTPGHGKLRRFAMERIAGAVGESKVKAIVFVVDAAAMGEAEALPPTATYLYEVLLALQKRASSTKSTKVAIPVLIAANKLDLFTAIPAPLVKTTLEAELSRVRSSKSKGLSGVGAEEEEEQDNWLGEYGSKAFTFAQMEEFDIKVDVVGGTTGGEGKPSVDKWWEWITQNVSA